MQKILKEHAHGLPAAEILDVLGVSREKGLDLFETEERRKRFGPNALTERKGRHPLVHFLLQFHQPLVYILLTAVAITAALGEFVDSSVIFGVVLVNAVVGYLQEAKALRAIKALARSLTTTAAVLRSGRKTQVDASELVPGDIVLLQSGDRVPADLRLITVKDLQIDESALTGEPVPAHKRVEPLPKDTLLGDRANIAFSSTLVTYGIGTGVVVATGDNTEIGRISEMIAEAEVLETPLTRKIARFSNLLLFVILGMSAIAFIAGLLHGEKPLDMFMAAVALAVGAIPEGLPAAVTIIMAIGVNRMAQRRAIIRRLPAVETLGSTTVICSDKTGTLTQNQMTVQAILAGGARYEVAGTGYAPEGKVLLDGQPVDAARQAPLLETLRCGLLCNDSALVQSEGLWRVQGDPTEGALLASAAKAGLQPDESRAGWPRLDAVPFESQHQYMATLHGAGGERLRVAYIKGSLESLLPRCRAAEGPSGEIPLDADAVRRGTESLAAEGLRVLAFARKKMPDGASTLNHEDIQEGLVLLGLQGMMDPPRPEAARAVAACSVAGIQVKMITGDHAVTAASIARQIGIPGSHGQDGQPRTLTGRDLEAISDEDLVGRAEDIAVFARVSPEHKLRLVKALQKRGHVVAMTGDGVNDAPALRRANIGVAMALGGTEVAREAADMILTDDNFASIEAAVEEGRGVFDNLRKFIVWTLPTNGGEALVLLIAIFLGLSLPVTPVQLLWINMMTAVCLGMTLAFEPKEAGIMTRPPNAPSTPLLDAALFGRIAYFSALLCGGVYIAFEWELARGAGLAAARTSSVAVLVFGELFYLFNCRSFTRSFWEVGLFSNPWVWVGALITAVFQVLFTYVPLMNRLFGSAPIDLKAWGLVVAIGITLSVIVEIEKLFRSRGRARL